MGVKGIISLPDSKDGESLAGVDRVHELSAIADFGVSHFVLEILSLRRSAPFQNDRGAKKPVFEILRRFAPQNDRRVGELILRMTEGCAPQNDREHSK